MLFRIIAACVAQALEAVRRDLRRWRCVHEVACRLAMVLGDGNSDIEIHAKHTLHVPVVEGETLIVAVPPTWLTSTNAMQRSFLYRGALVRELRGLVLYCGSNVNDTAMAK